MLAALEETKAALLNHANALKRRSALQAPRDQAGTAARIMHAQPREGQIDSLAQLDAPNARSPTRKPRWR